MSFANDTARTIIVRISLLSVSLVSGIINARWLGPEGVGVYSLLVLVSHFSFQFCNLGFGSAFAFFMGSKKASFQELRRLLWYLASALSAIACLIILCLWKISVSPWNDIGAGFFLLAVLGVPMMFFRNFMTRLLSGQLRIKVMNISEAIYSISNVLFLVALVVALRLGILGAIVSFLLASSVANFYLWSKVGRTSCEPNAQNDTVPWRARISDLWSYGRWNYLIMLCRFLLQHMPTLVLKYFFSNMAIGLFAVAQSLTGRLFIITNSFSEMLFPYTAASDDGSAVRRTNMLCRSFLILTVVFAALVGLLARYVIPLLYGEGFEESVQVIYTLLPTIVFAPPSKLLNIHIAARGDSKLSLLAILPGLAIGIAICMTMIPRYAAVGAGLSVSATYGALFLTATMVHSRITDSRLSEILLFNAGDWRVLRNLMGTQWLRRSGVGSLGKSN